MAIKEVPEAVPEYLDQRSTATKENLHHNEQGAPLPFELRQTSCEEKAQPKDIHALFAFNSQLNQRVFHNSSLMGGNRYLIIKSVCAEEFHQYQLSSRLEYPLRQNTEDKLVVGVLQESRRVASPAAPP